MDEETHYALKEARDMLDARWRCSNDALGTELENWVKELLGPFAAKQVPEAEYLLGALDGFHGETISEEEYDERYLERLKKGAAANVPEAMFYLAHWYWEHGKHEESSPLYKAAADAGHAYAKWCHGLDLLAGNGVAQDDEAGLKYIKEAAELKFEGAIQFMSNAHALGQYGFEKDDAKAASWQRQLGSKVTIGF